MTPKKFRIMKKATRQVRPLKWKSDEDGTHGPFETRPHWVGKSVFYYLRIKTKTKTEIIKSNQIKSNVICAPRLLKRTIRTDPYLLITSPVSPHDLSERKGRFRYIDIFIGAINAYHDRWFNFLILFIYFFETRLVESESGDSYCGWWATSRDVTFFTELSFDKFKNYEWALGYHNAFPLFYFSLSFNFLPV